MSPPLFPANNDATSTTGSPSPSPSPSSPSSTTSGGSNNSGTPASTTLLFGFLVIFVALFAAFLFLGFFWQYQRLRRRREADLDEGRGGDRKAVPKLWEAWIQDEVSGNPWSWENIRPLSIEVGHGSSCGQAAALTPMRSRRWPRNLFRHHPVPPAPPQPQPPNDGTGAEGQALSMYGSMRMTFVIAMPHTDAPNWRRSEISQVSRAEIWRGREYAIGVYHPPFWKRAPL